MTRIWLTLAAAGGFSSVAFGAFAAHGASGHAAELLKTGATYQFMHSVAMVLALVFADRGARSMAAPGAFFAGTVLFSGSLYALAFGAPRWMGMVTPFGGVLFLAGWTLLAVAAIRSGGERQAWERRRPAGVWRAGAEPWT